ncbi:Hypothetical protein NTJ_05601 [Nesidiocoris tenuis]|uniref:Uncharacterized protein n=1 Tax=Nesidiocoris tenuis TaxID=355587 RepID=A0ABN7ANC8_9HEMI|nr:Hypothetical protein NTJ_05601 [Nesidiocoris tenuis]
MAMEYRRKWDREKIPGVAEQSMLLSWGMPFEDLVRLSTASELRGIPTAMWTERRVNSVGPFSVQATKGPKGLLINDVLVIYSHRRIPNGEQ